jgi:hypothetical protein
MTSLPIRRFNGSTDSHLKRTQFTGRFTVDGKTVSASPRVTIGQCPRQNFLDRHRATSDRPLRVLHGSMSAKTYREFVKLAFD